MYWKEVRSESWTRTRNGLGSGYRRLTSIALPIAAFILSCGVLHAMNITVPVTLVVGVGSALTVYLLFVFGEWCYHLVKIPPEREQLLHTELIKLRTPPPELIRVVFKDVRFLPSDQEQNVSVVNMNVEIHNGGPATTLREWRLLSKVYPDVAILMHINIGDRWRPELQVVEIGERKVESGSISFRIKSGIDHARYGGNEWRLEFFDVTGQVYNPPVPLRYYGQT